MSTYLIQGESLTAIANEIRTLTGSTDEMGPDEMTSKVNAANNEIGSHAALIAQIRSALEAKFTT